MTTKEKTKDLFDKFDRVLPYGEEATEQTIKQCALIVIDEIISVLTPHYIQHTWFWEEVKEEINKL